jgi:hypothetical protein
MLRISRRPGNGFQVGSLLDEKKKTILVSIIDKFDFVALVSDGKVST